MFHAIDHILQSNDRFDSSRQELYSTKILRQGDAAWKTCKLILGWLIDTLRHHISLSHLTSPKVPLCPGGVPPQPDMHILSPLGMAREYFAEHFTCLPRWWVSFWPPTVCPQYPLDSSASRVDPMLSYRNGATWSPAWAHS